MLKADRKKDLEKEKSKTSNKCTPDANSFLISSLQGPNLNISVETNSPPPTDVSLLKALTTSTIVTSLTKTLRNARTLQSLKAYAMHV